MSRTRTIIIGTLLLLILGGGLFAGVTIKQAWDAAWEEGYVAGHAEGLAEGAASCRVEPDPYAWEEGD